MDQKNQGSGSPIVPKRKRGRPRKSETVVHHEEKNMTENETTDHHPMVGNIVYGVVEGTFGAGYLVNVKVFGEPDRMRGLMFKPHQVVPVTPENDIAPHLNMIKRKDLPIPPLVLNRHTGVHGFGPISVLPNTHTDQVHGSAPSSSVPVSEKHLIPTEKDLPMNETSIINAKLESDKTDKQGDTILHELDVDAFTKVKESNADGDGEATRDYSRPVSDSISLVETTENTDKELRTEQQAMPSVNQMNELVYEEPDGANIEIHVSAEPESMQCEDSEEISKSVDNIGEKQYSPKTDLLDKKPKPICLL